MALPTVAQIKARLRIEDDVEDGDIAIMRASAIGTIEELTGRPLTAVERTFVIECPADIGVCTSFFLPLYPVKHADPDFVTIADVDEVDVDAADFRVSTTSGRIHALGSFSFSNFPLTVVATVGLSLLPDYSTRVEPILSQVLLDLCADWYQRRSPAALAESPGGGVMTQWMGQGMGGMESPGIPMRITQMLQPYRLAKAH
jgi:uncharacterized phiE125 gp8 family phage protein